VLRHDLIDRVPETSPQPDVNPGDKMTTETV